MSTKPNSFSVISSNDDVPHCEQTGHYFDQTIFDLHYSLQSARARRMALEEDLARQGITVDPETGIVTLNAKVSVPAG